MKLDNRMLALIAVDASVTANCQQCLEITIGSAIKCGADEEQIAQAVEIGRRVRQGAASKFDKFAENLNSAHPSALNATKDGCGCSA